MATTPSGRRLTELHYQMQAVLAADTVSALEQLWMLLQSDTVLSEDEWVEATTALLADRHALSERAARSYYQAFRMAETGVFEQVRQFGGRAFAAGRVAERAARYPGYVRRLIEGGMSAAEAGRKAGRELTAELVESVLDGGRYTIIDTVQSDPEAVGWYRVTDGDPCAFCALLASRGAVYKSRQTGSFLAHWRCNCTAEAAYTRQRYRTPQAKQWGDMYNRATRGQRDPLNSFRRAYERPHLTRAP